MRLGSYVRCVFNNEQDCNKICIIKQKYDYLKNVNKQAKVKEYEKQIDKMAYELYSLIPEEIAIVEKCNQK